jgi:rhomboid-like protein
MVYSFLVHGDRAALSSFPGMQESTAIWHLTAFYLAAAIFASLGSHLHANLIALPRFLSRLSSAASAGIHVPRAELFKLARKAQLNGSVGASGALYAVMAVGALSFPHAQIGIIFLPFFTFPITWGVAALCALDLFGLLRGWQMFNHAAHLSGALFGGLYWRYGVRPLSFSLPLPRVRADIVPSQPQCDLWDWTLQKLRSSRPRGQVVQ